MVQEFMPFNPYKVIFNEVKFNPPDVILNKVRFNPCKVAICGVMSYQCYY